MSTIRTAVVKGNGVTAERVQAFLPGNYDAWNDPDLGVVVSGSDSCGWTLDDYVIPRLASGCMFAKEVTS